MQHIDNNANTIDLKFWQIMRRDTLYGNMAGICIIIAAYMPLWHTNGRYLFVQHNKKFWGYNT
ncbi:unnamed protein product [marine sediment metagenome]|uniref:Uncharacterized protein n=1 Tax=marine sediment metagenome TaxID=412755 RepID=X1N4G7_9ZZZZ